MTTRFLNTAVQSRNGRNRESFFGSRSTWRSSKTWAWTQFSGLAIADEAQGFVGRPCLYDGVMAYDEHLADRIRELLVGESRVTEKKMFGGLAFLIRGNMAVAASGQGGVLVRVDPAASDRLVATSNAHRMKMRGRAMQGWLRVESDAVRTKRQLVRWVRLGTTYARSLPAKR
jgi:TfoX/Sxy family transcriptional regulator of competence genes